MRRSAVLLVLLVSWTFPVCAPAPTTAAELTLSDRGRATLRVALGKWPSPAERTAAAELSTYLKRVTTADFEVVLETRIDAAEPAIWVGPTTMARKLGIDAGQLGPEEWRIRSDGHDLVLVGGRPRGTLYAVYRFLEDHVGVRWWTPFEDSVPHRTTLKVGNLDVGGAPAFIYRDLHGLRGSREFHARNRANGHYSFLPAAYGGNLGYGPPFMVHTLFMYVPPAEYFDAHPDFFSEIDGVRTGEKGQLCLTNPELVDVVENRLRRYMLQARVEAEKEGNQPAEMFDLSPNDWGGACTCEACSALDEGEGSRAVSLLNFVNELADRIDEDYPEVQLDTLAYMHTFLPPADVRLKDNVVLRLAALHYRDFARPVTHSTNRTYRDAILGWRKVTDHLRIWDYTVTFGFQANNLPFPNLPVVAADFRYYLEQGVEGLFIQHDHPVLSDMRDLKLWVVLKLAEDPARDLDALVQEFTDGFYGPAAAMIRQYLTLLRTAAEQTPAEIRYPVTYEQYRYLDASFFRRAQSLFDRAERLAGKDRTIRNRLRRARLSLDRATLLRWEGTLAQPADEAGKLPPINPLIVAQRYQDTAYREIDLRIHPARRDDHRERVDREIKKLLSRINE